MLGVVTVSEAMSMAVRAGLDLVEVSPNAEPPVCRIMDFGKFKYEQARKEREARKHQHAAEMKESKASKKSQQQNERKELCTGRIWCKLSC